MLETGDEHAHDRQPELWAGQVDRDGLAEPGAGELCELPLEIVADAIGAAAGDPVEWLPRAGPDQLERPMDRFGARAERVLLVRHVVARSRNVGEAALRSLRDRSGERDRAIGMAARSCGRGQSPGVARGALHECTGERWKPELAGEVPDARGDTRALQPGQQRPARPVGDSVEIDPRDGFQRARERVPDRLGVSFGEFAERVAERLGP
jgi:hypothetical protein